MTPAQAWNVLRALLAGGVVSWTPLDARAAGKGHRQEVPVSHDKPMNNVLEVRQFGARGDGTGFDTAAFQKALDAAGAAGGGIVHVPAGTYLLQPLELHSGTTLQLDEGSVLRASDDPRDYRFTKPDGKVRKFNFINVSRATDVSIAGRGVIDGSGGRWWRDSRAERVSEGHTDAERPRLIEMGHCQRVTLDGVTLQNAPMFHLILNDCDDVTVRNVTIHAPADSPNTDGIDPCGCHRVTISGCRIDTGDDDVAIKSFHLDPAHPDAACSDITIRDCTFLHGHGVSIGSETTGGVANVVVQHCTFEGTRFGFRIKSARGRGGLVDNIRVSDIQMRDVDPAVDIMCYYPHPPAVDAPQPLRADTPVYRHIHIENLTATCPREGLVIVGLPESPVTDVTLSNVHISSGRDDMIRDARVTRN